jgi:hypothetical protein
MPAFLRRLWIEVRDTGQHDRLAIGKSRHQDEAAAHCLDLPSQRRDVHVRALLNLGNLLLRDVQRPRHPGLRELAGTAQLLQGQLFRNQFGRSGFDLFALSGAERFDNVTSGLTDVLTNDRPFEQEGFRALFRDS